MLRRINTLYNLVWVLATLALSGCDNPFGQSEVATGFAAGLPPVALSSITVTPASLSLPLGLTQQFSATGIYSDSSIQDLTGQVTWGVIPNTGAASIGASGLLTTGATGTVTVTATLGNISGNASLTVAWPSVVSLSLSPASGSVALGLTQQFTATATLTDGTSSDVTQTVVWSVKNGTGSATLSPTGLLTSYGGSQGTVTVTAVSGAVTQSVLFSLTTPTLVSLALTPSNSSLALGSTQQFVATGTYTDGTTQDLSSSVTWSETNASGSASIGNSGLVNSAGGSQGTVTIKASTNGVNGQASLTILPLATPNALTATTTSTSASLNWTLPSGNIATGFILVRNAGSSISFTPTNGTTYSPGAVTGGTVLYNGPNLTYTDSSLTGGTQYTYAVFGYDSANNYTAGKTGTFVIGCDDIGAMTFAGSGTSGDPYLVCTATQLNQVSSYLSSNFLVVSNIDLSAYDGETPATTFNIIGSYNTSNSTGTPYTGKFDGGSHTISNLTLNQSTTTYATALFAYTSGATIQNLTLSNVNVNGGATSTAALVGRGVNTNLNGISVTGTVTGNPTSGSSTNGGSQVASILGSCYVSGTGGSYTYSNLSSSATVNGVNTVGGIIAFMSVSATSASVTMSNLQNNGNVLQVNSTYGDTMAGVLAYLSINNGASVTISNSSNSGEVTATGSWNGGFISTASIGNAGGTLNVNNSYNSGNISTNGATSLIEGGIHAGGCLGGFFGTLGNGTSGSITLTKLYSIGSVSHTGTVQTMGSNGANGIGGLAGCTNPSTGTTTSLTKSYTAGTVSVTSSAVTQVGGFIGSTSSYSSPGTRMVVSNSYSTATVSAPNSKYTGGFIGYNYNTVSDCFADNAVSGLTNYVGGMFGYNAGAYATSSYWNSNLNSTEGTGNSTGVSGLTTGNFASEGNFSGWDFTNTWNNPAVIGYPNLQ